MTNRRCGAPAPALMVALALVLAALLSPSAGAAPVRDLALVEQAGPVDGLARCAGRWAPIQAKVSGFVVGNCRGGSVVRAIAVDICAPGCMRGAPSEGRAWAAVVPPRGARFRGCGWLNVTNRLRPAAATDHTSSPGCAALDGPDVALPQSFVKRYAGRSVGGAPPPSTTTYRGLYLWAGHFHSGRHRGREGGAVAYRPRLPAGRTCTAYANVDPLRPGGRVSARERMWTVHDRSPHLQIRYVARYRARDEHGRLRWWVNAHSTAPSDRDRPWGFIAAECLFAGRHHAARRPDPTLHPSAMLGRIDREPRGAGRKRCDFAPTGFHRILATRGMGCAAAKAALRQLRGDHALAPMACSHPRRIRGWRLTNLVRDPSLAVTRYRRATRSFDFQRHQFPGNIWCPAPH